MAYLIDRRNNSRGGGRNFDRRGPDNRNSEPRQMFKAVCSRCGKDCEVPFRPTGDKPVFCSDCFRSNQGSGSSDRRDDNRSSSRFNDRRDSGDRRESNVQNSPAQPNYKQEFMSLNSKLDKILNMLSVAANTSKPAAVKKEKAVEKVEKVETKAVVEKQEKKTEVAKPKKKTSAVKKTAAAKKK